MSEDNDKKTTEERIVEKLEQIGDGQNAQSQLSQLLSDPDIRAVLEAKQKGESVQVGTPSEPEPKDPFDGVDLNDITNEELVGLVMKAVPQRVEGVLSSALKPLVEKVNLLTASGTEDRQRLIQDQINDARKSHKDFDEFSKEMLTENERLSKEGLSPEDLYVLTKARMKDDAPEQQEAETERPTGHAGKAPAEKPNVRPGRRGMQELLEEAVEGLDIKDLS